MTFMPPCARICWMLVIAGILVGCSRNDQPDKATPDTTPPEKKVVDQPEQKITALNEDDHKRLRDQRAVIEKYLGNEKSKENYKTPPGKLGTIRAILEGKVFKRDQTYELQCLGVILGDVFV